MTVRSMLCVAALALAACATAPPAKTAETTPCKECPKVDAERISDITQVDQETQQQIAKVDELAKRVQQLQAALNASLKSGAAPLTETQASVSTSGGNVRVRLSDELVFASASARITHAGQKALAQVATVLKETPSKRIEIAGHTDSSPITKKYGDNWELSLERARRVGNYLITQGIDPKRIKMTGYGDTEPVDAADQTKNRRVEIFIEPTGGDAAK